MSRGNPLVIFRLYRHNRKCGMTVRRAFFRAWAKAWERDPFHRN